MTLGKYQEAMQRVKVTPEMRARILRRIALEEQKRRNRRVLSIAACLLICVASAGVFTQVVKKDLSGQGMVAQNPAIEDVGSLEALSASVGFSVCEIPKEAIPFAVTQTVYTSYWGNLAQIHYLGEENSLTFRQSAGEEDNSGIYEEFKTVKTVTVAGHSVTFSGSGQMYTLATWSADGFAHSIALESGISEAELTALVESVRLP